MFQVVRHFSRESLELSLGFEGMFLFSAPAAQRIGMSHGESRAVKKSRGDRLIEGSPSPTSPNRSVNNVIAFVLGVHHLFTKWVGPVFD